MESQQKQAFEDIYNGVNNFIPLRIILYFFRDFYVTSILTLVMKDREGMLMGKVNCVHEVNKTSIGFNKYIHIYF